MRRPRTISLVLAAIAGVLMGLALTSAYGQDFTNLPSGVKGKITLENSYIDERPGYRYIALYRSNEADEQNRVYWVAVHRQTKQVLSAGHVKLGVRGSCKHWNLVEGEWETTTCMGEVLWIIENDVPKESI